MTKQEKKLKVTEQLKAFLPAGFESMVADLIFNEPVSFKIVKPRNTKLGDFRAGLNGEKHQITVNGNLNKYSFLITTLHEFAHLITYLKFGHRIKPHGEEWKQEYRNLLVPAIDTKLLPSDIVRALVNSLVNTKASSCSDIGLMRVLKNYDEGKEDIVFLESLPNNSIFVLQGKKFIKGELRRKRYLCEDLSTKKKYLVHALSEVKTAE
ncbi:MAG: SprT-like domain-containing protein [Flavobacteriia bacterium]|jgi:SprT protein